MSSEFCKEASQSVRKLTGWNFAKVLFLCFGPTSIVLEKEGPDGSNLELSVDENWLMRNHPCPEPSQAMHDSFKQYTDHVSQCTCPDCTEARSRIQRVLPYLRPNDRKIPGGEALLLLREFSPSGLSITTNRKDGEILVAELQPILMWFTGEPELWIHPPEK